MQLYMFGGMDIAYIIFHVLAYLPMYQQQKELQLGTAILAKTTERSIGSLTYCMRVINPFFCLCNDKTFLKYSLVIPG